MRYDAFISYSHAKDKAIAKQLQGVVQTLGKPWYKRRVARIFHDNSSLTAAPELWETIVAALEKSDHLVLLASPEAARSQWVNKEVAWWLENKSVDTILVALTDGSLAWSADKKDFSAADNHPLPDALKNRFRSEPLWIDLRQWRTHPRDARKDNAFKQAASRIAGRIRGQSPEDLWSEEVRQQKRNLRIAYAGAAALLLLSVLATGLGLYARDQQSQAEIRRLEAEDQRKIAETQTIEAENQRKIAENQRDEAERQRSEADAQRQIAEAQTAEAEKQKREAERQRKEADAQRDEAERQRTEAEKQQQIAEDRRKEAERLLLRQIEANAGQDLRNGNIALAASKLQQVVDAGEPGLFSQAKQNLLLSQLTTFDDAFKALGNDPVFSWNGKTYIRGEDGKSLVPVPRFSDPKWIEFGIYLILLNSPGYIAVFDRTSGEFVDVKYNQNHIELCDVKFGKDLSVSVYGVTLYGLSNGGTYLGRWTISPRGVPAYAEQNIQDEWVQRGICSKHLENSKTKSPLFDRNVRNTRKIGFPSNENNSLAWDISKISNYLTRSDRFLSSVPLGNITHNAFPYETVFSGSHEDGTFKAETIYDYTWRPENYQDLIDKMFEMYDPIMEPQSARREKNSFNLRMSIYGMGGEGYVFCVKYDNDKIDCTNLMYDYSASFNGIAISSSGTKMAVFGKTLFDTTDHDPNAPVVRSSGNIQIGQVSQGVEWSEPEALNGIGEILDASFSPDESAIAVLTSNDIQIWSLDGQKQPLGVFPRNGAMSISWIDDKSLAYVTGEGVVRSATLDGAEVWPELNISDLPFVDRYKDRPDLTDSPSWWINFDAENGALVAGNGQNAVVIDGLLGAPLTKYFSYEIPDESHFKTSLDIETDGSVTLTNSLGDTATRKGLRRPITDITRVTARRDGNLVQDLRDLLD